MFDLITNFWRKGRPHKPARPTHPTPATPPPLTALPAPCFGLVQKAESGDVLAMWTCDGACKVIVLFSTARRAAARLAANDEHGEVVRLATLDDVRTYLKRAAAQHNAHQVQLDPTSHGAAGSGRIDDLTSEEGR